MSSVRTLRTPRTARTPRTPRTLRLLALAGLLTGGTLAILLSARPDGAPGPSLNNPLRAARIDACIRPRRPAGLPAYTADGALLPFTVSAGHEPGTRPRCPPGDLRILRLSALTIRAQLAYVRRGGCQEPCRVRQPTVHLLAGELRDPVPLLPVRARNGDGAPVPGCREPAHTAPALATGDLGRMFYKTPRELRGTRRRTGEIGAGARWSNYGDPGRRFPSPSGVSADYTYLLWNLPRRASGGLLPGGGIVEALLAQGQAVQLCAGRRLTLPSYDLRGAGNGYVAFAYAAAPGPPPIHGWLLLGYRYRDRPFRSTLTMP